MRRALTPTVFALTTLALIAPACATSRTLPDGGGLDGAGLDARVDGSHDAGHACGSEFPSFDRRCSVATECVAVSHQINCCGTVRALGIRADAQSGFDVAEAACRDITPACGCPTEITRADDDTIDDGAPARVECVAGQCVSTFGRASGAACSAEQPCGPGLSCCYPCGIPGCENRCEPSCAEGDPGCAGGCLLRP